MASDQGFSTKHIATLECVCRICGENIEGPSYVIAEKEKRIENINKAFFLGVTEEDSDMYPKSYCEKCRLHINNVLTKKVTPSYKPNNHRKVESPSGNCKIFLSISNLYSKRRE